MTQYIEIFTHKFDNADDMHEHLRRDTQNFAKIEKRLRRSGMVSATQYVSERSANISMWDNYFVKARRHMTHVCL